MSSLLLGIHEHCPCNPRELIRYDTSMCLSWKSVSHLSFSTGTMLMVDLFVTPEVFGCSKAVVILTTKPVPTDLSVVDASDNGPE